MSEKSEKCLKKRKHDSKYKTWASEFAEIIKGSEETRRRRRAHIEMDRNCSNLICDCCL